MRLSGSAGGGARVLCMGQSGSAIGKEIEKISDFLPGVGFNKPTFVSDEVHHDQKGDSANTSASNAGKSRSSLTRLMKCAHTLTEQTEFCSVCSKNAEVLQEVVLRNMLEAEDNTSLTKLCLVSDVYTQFSSWASSISLEYLQQEVSYSDWNEHDCYNHGGLISILAKPPMGATSGLESFYALLSSHYSLISANCTLYRGMERVSTPMSTTASPVQNNGAFGVACDLFPILCASDCVITTSSGGPIHESEASRRVGYNSSSRYDTFQSYIDTGSPVEDVQFHLWPFDTVTNNNVIIDARSSLSSLLKKILKPKSSGGSNANSKSNHNVGGVEYHSLRSLASNIHNMHLAYCELYPDLALHERILSANYANLSFLDSQVRGGCGNSLNSRDYLRFCDVLQSEHDLSVSLNWATPGVKWPYHNANNSNKGTASHLLETTAGIAGVQIDAQNAEDSSNSIPNKSYTRPCSASSEYSVRSTVSNATSGGARGGDKRSAKVLKPLNAVNTGSRGVRFGNNPGSAEDSTDCDTIGTTGTIGAGDAGKSRMHNSTRSSQASVMSAMSRNNSRNMYSLTSSIRKIQDTDSHGKTHTISSVVFDSPYGRKDCRHICASSRDLLGVGAYRHLFGPAGSAFTSDELVDALEVVERYCTPHSR